jgi:MFS family permease
MSLPINIEKKNQNIILQKQLNPIYLLEIAVTFFSGVLGSSVSNHILLELHFEAWIASVIVSLFYLGFFTSTLFFIKIAERHNLKHVIRYIFTAKIAASLFYFIPIHSREYLIVFGLVYFFDGTLNGLFWPLIQNISVITEKVGGKKLKNGFLRRYNFSWNIGFMSGMIAGTIFLYFIPSNYLAFYLSFAAVIVGNCIAWGFSGHILQKLQDLKKIPISSDSILEKNDSEQQINLKNSETESSQNLSLIPLYVILCVLLAHSLTDGALIIVLPLKINSIGQASYWVFFMGMMKLIFQTISTTSFSNLPDNKIIKGLTVTLIFLAIDWILFVINSDLFIMAILLSISGFLQGSVYALGMRFVSYKARDLKQVTPFSRFQSMMSGGRLVGPLLIGFGSGISLEVGVWILVAYQFFAFITLIIKSKK